MEHNVAVLVSLLPGLYTTLSETWSKIQQINRVLGEHYNPATFDAVIAMARGQTVLDDGTPRPPAALLTAASSKKPKNTTISLQRRENWADPDRAEAHYRAAYRGRYGKSPKKSDVERVRQRAMERAVEMGLTAPTVTIEPPEKPKRTLTPKQLKALRKQAALMRERKAEKDAARAAS